MKALKVIGIVIVFIGILIAGSIFFLPDTTHMERSAEINASPEQVYRELVSYRNFNKWSPWFEKDTTTQYQFEGPAFGVGSRLSWISEELGNGSMEIVGVSDTSVTSLMKFDGFDSSPTATWIVSSMQGGTKITWTYDESGMSGFGKILGSVMDMFLGPDYERGLSNLKSWVESGPKLTTPVVVTNVSPIPYVGISDTSSTDPALLSSKMSSSYGKLTEFLTNVESEIGGSPFAIITAYTPQEIAFTCALPYKGVLETVSEGIVKATNYGGLALKATYKGDYSGTEAAHNDIAAYAAYAGYELIGAPWEEYVTDPSEEADPANWVTLIFYPVN